MKHADANALWIGAAGRERRRRRGFSLIEAAVSIVIVGGLLVVALNTVGASKRTQYLTATRSRGQLLAQALMAEILRQRFEDPDVPDGFGREAGEGGSKRDRFDDVDDYHNWSGSPPQDKDGRAIPGFEGWTRSAAVAWVHPEDLTGSAGSPTGVKRITVTVKRGELVVASMVAVRTEAWPEDEDDDTVSVLFVVTSEAGPTAQELARKALMESWGFPVALVSAAAPQGSFDTAAADANVAYVSEEINANDLGTKLRGAAIGVVNEDRDLYDEFGFSSSAQRFTKRTTMAVSDNTHYITSPFGIGELTIYSSPQSLCWPSGTRSPDLEVLAKKAQGGVAVLTVLQTGARLHDGGTAAGRRVQMPWGTDGFDFNSLTEDAKTVMKRAIEWAANCEEAP